MIAPVGQVRRFRNPDVIPANRRARRPVEGEIFSADFFLEDGAVLVVRRENHPRGIKVPPIPGSAQADTDAIFGDRGEGEQKLVSELRHTTILDAIGLEATLSEEG